MPNCTRRQPQRAATPQAATPPPFVPRTLQEPTVRRWPHPMEPVFSTGESPSLCEIRRMLGVQIQLLQEIKLLLEQSAARES